MRPLMSANVRSLAMNSFTYILMILTTSGLGGVQQNTCSAPVARILEKYK